MSNEVFINFAPEEQEHDVDADRVSDEFTPEEEIRFGSKISDRKLAMEREREIAEHMARQTKRAAKLSAFASLFSIDNIFIVLDRVLNVFVLSILICMLAFAAWYAYEGNYLMVVALSISSFVVSYIAEKLIK